MNRIAGQTAHFGAQFEFVPVRLFSLPLDGKAQGRLFAGGFSQNELVGVALVEAGGKRMATFAVNELG